MSAFSILRRGYDTFRRRFLFEPMSKSRTVRRMVLHAEGAANIEGAAALIYDCSDHVMAVHPHDRTIGRAIRHGGGYQRHEIDFAMAWLKERGMLCGKTFLDVGANIGTQTVYALLSGNFERVVAVEPEPRNLVLLRYNLALNSLAHKVTVFEVAGGESDGVATLYLNAENFGAHSLTQARKDHGSVNVQIRSVDSLISKSSVNPSEIGMISLDIEGHEPAALRGMRDILEHKPPLIIELNPEGPDFGTMLDDLKSRYSKVLRLSGPNLAKLASPESAVDAADFVMPEQKIDALFC